MWTRRGRVRQSGGGLMPRTLCLLTPPEIDRGIDLPPTEIETA